MESLWHKFVTINYKSHLLLSFIIRLILIIYGIYHDLVSDVPYTDIDYKVFTDASRYVYDGMSPYNRHTYRYSPLIAILLVPNVILHHSFGKIVFSVCDIIVALLIRLIVKGTLNEYEIFVGQNSKKLRNDENLKTKGICNVKPRRKHKYHQHINLKLPLSKSINVDLERLVNISMLLWLYNPLTVAISTRGNCDSFAALLVLLTLYYIQCKHSYFIAGLIHGISVHFRLYPIIYSLSFFMYLSKFANYTTNRNKKINGGDGVKSLENVSSQRKLKNVENSQVVNCQNENITYDRKEERTIFKGKYLLYVIPNLNQIKLIVGCITSLSILTWIFYALYGYSFIYETYIYHFIRKDTRHNFSLYFYLQYLTAWVKNIGMWQKVLIVLPQIVLLLVFSVRYGLNKFSLNFSILTQTVVMVIYNTVLTSQYFVWIMAILPLCAWQIKIPKNMSILLVIIWFAAQGAWLLPAYLLEFKEQNTFLFIWIQGVSLFCVNIAILGRFIMNFMPLREKSM